MLQRLISARREGDDPDIYFCCGTHVAKSREDALPARSSIKFPYDRYYTCIPASCQEGAVNTRNEGGENTRNEGEVNTPQVGQGEQTE